MKLALRYIYAHFFTLAFGIILLLGPIAAGLQGLLPRKNQAATSSLTPSSDRGTRNSAAVHSELGTLQSPIFFRSVPDTESESDAAHKRYEQQEKPSLDRGIAYATYALALSTFLLTIFTGLMWHATYKLAKIGKANADQQAADTRDALAISKSASDAAKEAADAAKQQILIASDELHRSHRPWLTLADQSIHCVFKIVDQKISTTLSCDVINGGSSIAKSYNNFFNLIVAPSDADPRNYITQTELPDVPGFGGLLLPGAKRSISIDLSQNWSHITTSHVNLLISLTLVYIDEFDKKHSTRHVLRFRTESDDPGVSKKAKIVRGSFELFGIGAHAD